MRSLWSAVVAVAAAALPSMAQDGKAIAQGAATSQVGTGRAWALLIGVDKYMHLPRLRFCSADAKLLGRILTRQCGFDPDRVLVMTDAQTDPAYWPVRSNLVVKIPGWLRLVQPDDRVIVLFSGHGFLDERGRMYLAPLDCDGDNLALTGLSVSHLRDYLTSCRARIKLLILDTCHAGAAKGGKAIGVQAERLGRVLQKAEGLVTLASCRADEVSHERPDVGHGAFTYFLSQGLAGQADRTVQGNGDGIVTLDELYAYAYDKVTTWSMRTKGKLQTPRRLSAEGVSGIIALARVRRDKPPDKPREPERDPAHDLYTQAKAKYEAGAYAEALALCKRARAGASATLREEIDRVADQCRRQGDESDWARTRRTGARLAQQGQWREAMDAYQQYMKAHPSGRYAKRAARAFVLLKDYPAVPEGGRAGLFDEIARRIEQYYYTPITLDRSGRPDFVSLLLQLDPYSAYISPATQAWFRRAAEGSFGGVGIQISVEQGKLAVICPLPGTPAYHAGVRPGDRIVAIDGKDTTGISLQEAVKRLTGKPGTTVVIRVLPEGAAVGRDITIRRQVIRAPTVSGVRLRSGGSWDHVLDRDARIGYVRLSCFTRLTSEQLKGVVGQLEREDMKALILDLRNNPGGLLSAALAVADLFLSEGLILTVSGRASPEKRHSATRQTGDTRLRLVVLVNQYTASGSEAVAAALQGHRRATIVGETTWGKASVQNLMELGQGRGMLKLTAALFYPPKGPTWHEKGLSPDFRVELDTEAAKKVFDAWRDISAGKASTWPDIDPQCLAALRLLRR